MTGNTVTSSSAVTGLTIPGRTKFCGFMVATDGANDPTVAIYDNTAGSGTILVPSTTFDASALGINGAMLFEPIPLSTGLYVDITCAGTVSVTVYTTNRTLMGGIH